MNNLMEKTDSQQAHILQIWPNEEIIRFHRYNAEWPFVTCYYMIIMSIYEYFHINQLACLLGMGFAYEFIENEKRIAFSYKVIPFERNNTVNDPLLLGLNMISYEIMEEHPLDIIKHAIDNGHPLNCMLDIYYLEGREGYYHEHHGGHNILITGYDDAKEVFYVMDNVDSYSIYEWSYETMAYCIEQTKGMEGGENFVFLVEITYDKRCDTYDSAWVKNAIEEYKRNLDSIKDQWANNCKELDTMIERLDDLIRQKQFIINIESVIYRMSSELYILTKTKEYGIYEESKLDRICELKRKIIDKWYKFRLKLIQKDIRGDKTTENLVGSLVEIKEMEREILTLR